MARSAIGSPGYPTYSSIYLAYIAVKDLAPIDHTLPPGRAAHACVADVRPSLSRLGWGAEAWKPSATSPPTISGPWGVYSPAAWQRGGVHAL
eukprot:3720454-Pleurochrysis_carterae.AAC.2